MPHAKYINIVPQSNPVAPTCFAVSAVAFLASFVGLIVNHWLSGWMAVGGMACIGLFYLAIGLISYGSRIPIYRSETASPELDAATSVETEMVDYGNSPMLATSTNSPSVMAHNRSELVGKSSVTASDVNP